MGTVRKLRRYDDVSQSLTHLSTISIQSCCKIRLHWRGNHEPQENAIISIRSEFAVLLLRKSLVTV